MVPPKWFSGFISLLIILHIATVLHTSPIPPPHHTTPPCIYLIHISSRVMSWRIDGADLCLKERPTEERATRCSNVYFAI